MKWTSILKNPIKIRNDDMTKIVDIVWEEEIEELPDTYMVPSRFLNNKKRVLEYLSKKFKAKALDYDEYGFF